MTSSDLLFMPAVAAAALIRRKKLSPVEYMDAVLAAVDRLQPKLNCFITITAEEAKRGAKVAEEAVMRGEALGPLHGIPVLVKDNIATDDNMETTAGSLALVHSRVPADAVIIQQLREAGAVILGKANLGEWANFRGNDNVYPLAVGWSARGGSTNNAYDLSYTSWGSSAGSANGAAASDFAIA